MNNGQISYLIDKFNIKSTNPYIIDDIADSMNGIDFEEFRKFVNHEVRISDFNYYSGISKLNEVVKRFKSKKKSNVINDEKVVYFSEKLFKKTCDCFDEIAWVIQSGKDIESDEVKTLIYKFFGGQEKEIRVLKEIGSKNDILNAVKNRRHSLEDEIKEIVVRFALLKDCDNQIGYKDKEVIKKIENKG